MSADELLPSELTDAQKEWYLANSDCCPYCREGDVRGTGDTDYSGESIFRAVECTECGREWTDEYKLAAVHAVE